MADDDPTASADPFDRPDDDRGTATASDRSPADDDPARSRAGGDATAAATVAEREAVARGDDDLFDGDDS